jgi:hypothetical protein
MNKLLVGLGLVIAFAVAVTGLATLLNGVFGCHIAIEGTEAPADVRGGIILLCLALTILLCLLPFVHARLSQLLSTYRLLILPYLALTLGITGLPVYLQFNRGAPYADAHAALWRGDAAFFREAKNLQSLKSEERERLFAETIRHKRADIARLLAPTLNNLSGNPESPNAFLAAYTANAEILQLLIDHNADLSYREPLTGNGLLHQIVSGKGDTREQLQCLRLLHKRNMLDVNATGNFGTTPLMIAAERGNTAVVKQLIALGAAANQQDQSKSTALHKVCDKTIVYPDTSELPRLEVAQILLRAGADPGQKNAVGYDCVELAKAAGFRKLAASLRH